MALLFLPKQAPFRDKRVKALRPWFRNRGFFLWGVCRGRLSARRPASSSWVNNRAMDSLYLGVKALHLIVVASWFACLFYLPRLFINLCSVPPDSHAERERLLLMARRLHRFASLLMWPGLALGVLLWLYFGVGKGPGNGWLHAKLAVVVLTIGYHHACRGMLRRFEQFTNRRSERWYRWFNELAVVMFAAAVILVIVKPF